MRIVFILMFIYSAAAFSDEPKAISVEFDKALLQISGKIAEQTQGGFMEPQWKLGIKADLSKQIDMHFEVGAAQLLYKPNWVASTNEKISLLEAIATMRTSFVDFYAGQFLLPWGLEGQLKEDELYFPRTLLYERGLFILRDYGAGFMANHEGFSFDVAIHNGEGAGTTGDNKLFVTGQWAYETPAGAGFGLSVTEGRYSNYSTLIETRVRGANLNFKFNFANLNVQIEGSGFQSFAGSTETDWLAWHSDLVFHLNDEINFLGRYEQYNPDLKTVQNVLGRGTFALEWHNRNGNSRLFFYLIKNNESLSETPNDEFRVTWRVITL